MRHHGWLNSHPLFTTPLAAPGCWLKQLIKGGLNKQIHSLLYPIAYKSAFNNNNLRY